MEMDEVNVGNVCRGALFEMFDKLFPQLLTNIKDPNTKATAKRKLTIEIILEPNDERNYADVQIVPSIKMSGMKPATGSIFIASVKGKATAFNHDPRQDEINFAAVDTPKI